MNDSSETVPNAHSERYTDRMSTPAIQNLNAYLAPLVETLDQRDGIGVGGGGGGR